MIWVSFFLISFPWIDCWDQAPAMGLGGNVRDDLGRPRSARVGHRRGLISGDLSPYFETSDIF